MPPIGNSTRFSLRVLSEGSFWDGKNHWTHDTVTVTDSSSFDFCLHSQSVPVFFFQYLYATILIRIKIYNYLNRSLSDVLLPTRAHMRVNVNRTKTGLRNQSRRDEREWMCFRELFNVFNVIRSIFLILLQKGWVYSLKEGGCLQLEGILLTRFFPRLVRYNFLHNNIMTIYYADSFMIFYSCKNSYFLYIFISMLWTGVSWSLQPQNELSARNRWHNKNCSDYNDYIIYCLFSCSSKDILWKVICSRIPLFYIPYIRKIQ